MLDYDFIKLIKKHPDISSDKLYQEITSVPFSTPKTSHLIDEIWQRMIACSVKGFEFDTEFDTESILNAIKGDILMSLYASLVFTNTEPISRNEIPKYLREKDPALLRQESYDSECENLSHHRNNLRNFYVVKHKPDSDDNKEATDFTGLIDILTYGQSFSGCTLSYFRQFWEKDEIKCFDVYEFVKYIKAHSSWPFWKDNFKGMSFFRYFNGIRNMAPISDLYIPNKTISSSDFNYVFSCYIFEELFLPARFIQNVTLHLSTFKDIFSITKNSGPERERSIFLMRPLFRLPNQLWELLSEKYIKSLSSYIRNPETPDISYDFQNTMEDVIFCGEYIFPLIKKIVGSIIYSENNEDKQSCLNILQEYISDHITIFDYPTRLCNQMCSLAQTNYPNFKSANPIPLDIPGENLWKQPKGLDNISRSKPLTDDIKRNNYSIKIYESNFTYYFFCLPNAFDFFSSKSFMDPITYVNWLINSYLNDSYGIKKSTTDIGVLRKIKLWD